MGNQKEIVCVIPCGGKSSRMRAGGYKIQKGLIEVNGKTVLDMVMDNYRNVASRFILIPNIEDLNFFIFRFGNREDVTIIPESERNGAASGVLCAKGHIDNDTPVIIADGDQYKAIDMRRVFTKLDEVDGLLLIMPSNGEKSSHVKVDDNGLALEIREKEVISPYAIAGTYYVSKWVDYVNACEKAIEKDDRHNGEFYVSGVFQNMIKDGKTIKTRFILSQDFYELGTPKEFKDSIDRLMSEGYFDSF